MLQFNLSAREMQKSASTHKRDAALELKSFSLQLLAVVNTSRDAFVQSLCEAAGVPSVGCSRSQLEKSDFFKLCESKKARTEAGVLVALTNSAEAALRFDNPQRFANIAGEVHEMRIKCAAFDDAICEKFAYYIEQTRKEAVKVTKKYINAETKQIETKTEAALDANGKKIYKDAKVKKYICADTRKYTFAQIYNIFAECINMPQTIAAQKIAEAEAKLAQTIAKEAALAARLAEKAQKAKETAKGIEAKAAKAGADVRAKAEKYNTTIAEAQAKTAKAEEAKAAAKAEAEAALAKVGARKKSNTKTKAAAQIAK